MTEREALKLALEAFDDRSSLMKWQKARDAVREALAQPEQEPVAWMTITPYGEEDDIWYENPEGKLLDDWTYKPLYTTPPKAQPEQKYRRGDRLVCLETDEYCVIHIAGTDRQWVKFPDTHIGVYTNEQVDQLFEKLARETDLAQPEQEPQYAGTARELFTNAAIERLDVRPSTKVYLGTPSVCEQPAHQEPVWDASAPMVVHPHPAFQATPPQSEPVIDKSAAVRIATALGWEPQRTWQGLTDEEIGKILERGDIAERDAEHGWWHVLPYSFSRAIEAKLKEKNT